jgi:hypothetical protein
LTSLGVEAGGKEYSFGGNASFNGSGIYEITPKTNPDYKFSFSIPIGKVRSRSIVKSCLNLLMEKYKASQYNMLSFNCNHFCNEFLSIMVNKKLPAYLNRAANLAQKLMPMRRG